MRDVVVLCRCVCGVNAMSFLHEKHLEQHLQSQHYDGYKAFTRALPSQIHSFPHGTNQASDFGPILISCAGTYKHPWRLIDL